MWLYRNRHNPHGIIPSVRKWWFHPITIVLMTIVTVEWVEWLYSCRWWTFHQVSRYGFRVIGLLIASSLSPCKCEWVVGFAVGFDVFAMDSLTVEEGILWTSSFPWVPCFSMQLVYCSGIHSNTDTINIRIICFPLSSMPVLFAIVVFYDFLTVQRTQENYLWIN